ncbi:MAG: isoaspartyl peptidase/L-asparaginase [Planctomycetes bacterium]|nr:isoaspartyl peptidase/L-asparaginase [Planctomycetota bacterium]
MNTTALIVTHGGVGSRSEDSDGCQEAARLGMYVLQHGGGALDAGVAAVVHLEDDPRYNAGTGANLRLDGSLEMDASCMTGAGEIGAVAAIREVKNPVLVAREMIATPHVLLCGDGAVRFARARGFLAHDNSTPRAVRRRQEALERLRSGDLPPEHAKWRDFDWDWTGTVGAVARDRLGRFATATSTGGTAFMLAGRVGDTPVPGAGYWAGEVGAISCTGIGEEIIRKLMARRVYDSLAAGDTAQGAAEASLAIIPDQISFGVIVVSTQGSGIAATHQMAAATVTEQDED